MKTILESQVRAAKVLFDRTPSYTATELALRAIADRLKEDNRESCLLKTIAIDCLLNTNLYDVLGMAKHVHEVLEARDSETGPGLVDKLSRFKEKSHLSFASKYAHFFLDAKRHPIYDQYVCRSIAHHRESKRIWPKDYPEFASWLGELEGLSESSFDTKDLDRYLWLSGMYRHWKTKREKSEVGRDARELFKSADEKIQETLDKLDPK